MSFHFNYHPRWFLGDNQSARSCAPVASKWLWPGNRTFLEVASMVVTWWIVAFWPSASLNSEQWSGVNPSVKYIRSCIAADEMQQIWTFTETGITLMLKSGHSFGYLVSCGFLRYISGLLHVCRSSSRTHLTCDLACLLDISTFADENSNFGGII